MPIKLYIPRGQLAGLAMIRDLGTTKLSEVIDHIKTLEHPLNVDELEAVVAPAIGDRTGEFLQQLLAISGLARHRDLSPRQVFHGITRGLQEAATQNRWSDEEINRWVQLEGQVVALLELRQVHVVAKAHSLSYDYENLLQHIRIITDIRPVFDEARTNIEGAVVSQTLRVVYDTGSQTNTLSIFIDAEDLEHLKTSCELAIRKAEQARASIRTQMGIPAMIAGENGKDDGAG